MGAKIIALPLPTP